MSDIDKEKDTKEKKQSNDGLNSNATKFNLYDSLLKLNSEIEPIDFSKIMPNTYSFLDTDILNVNLGDKAKSKNNGEGKRKNGNEVGSNKNSKNSQSLEELGYTDLVTNYKTLIADDLKTDNSVVIIRKQNIEYVRKSFNSHSKVTQHLFDILLALLMATIGAY